jgi:hypothetical protein
MPRCHGCDFVMDMIDSNGFAKQAVCRMSLQVRPAVEDDILAVKALAGRWYVPLPVACNKGSRQPDCGFFGCSLEEREYAAFVGSPYFLVASRGPAHACAGNLEGFVLAADAVRVGDVVSRRQIRDDVVCSILLNIPGSANDGFLYVDQLAVAAPGSGMGGHVAKQLCHDVLKSVKANGLKRVWCVISHKPRNERSVRFVQKYGLKYCGTELDRMNCVLGFYTGIIQPRLARPHHSPHR